MSDSHGASRFVGDIARAQVFSRALTKEEVALLAQNKFDALLEALTPHRDLQEVVGPVCEVIIERENILEEHHLDLIIDSGVKSVILHKEDVSAGDYSIIYNTLQKDTSNSEKEAVEHIYRQLRNAEPPDEETARGIIDKLFFSDKRYDLGDVGRYRINKKLGLEIAERLADRIDQLADRSLDGVEFADLVVGVEQEVPQRFVVAAKRGAEGRE